MKNVFHFLFYSIISDGSRWNIYETPTTNVHFTDKQNAKKWNEVKPKPKLVPRQVEHSSESFVKSCKIIDFCFVSFCLCIVRGRETKQRGDKKGYSKRIAYISRRENPRWVTDVLFCFIETNLGCHWNYQSITESLILNFISIAELHLRLNRLRHEMQYAPHVNSC